MRLQDLEVNPLIVVSSFLLLLAPFTNWVVLSGFGLVVGSGLWDVATYHTSFLISTSEASFALYSGILLLSSGALLIKSRRIGLLIGSAALVTFTLESYSMFGTFGTGLQILILPGVGFLVALLGLVAGGVSYLTRPIRISEGLRGFATQKGLTYTGLLIGSIAFAMDGWIHWSTGHLTAFLGSGPFEEAFHAMPWIALILLLILQIVVPGEFATGRVVSIVVIVGFSGVVFDAFYHASTGSVAALVGDGPGELLLHALSYYGMAVLVIAKFLLKR